MIQTEKRPDGFVYKIAFPRRLNGWLGFFFQLTFPGLDNTALEITSEVNIIPETYPYDDCYRDSCVGKLV